MNKRFVAALSGALLLGGGIVIAQTITVPTITAITPTVDLIKVIPNGTPAASNVYATARTVNQVGSGLYTTTATAATSVGTGEETLATYSLPANWLSYTGRRLHVHGTWHAATNGNNKTVKCYFGASVISSGVLTTSNKNGVCDLYVVKTGASTQIVTGTMLVDTTPITSYLNAGSDTDTAAIVIKLTGQDGSASAGDIVMEDFYVEAIN